MLKSLVIGLVLLASCGRTPTEPVEPPDTDAPQKGQHFCCKSTDLQWWKGQGCTPASKEHVAACTEVLYCSADWGRSGDTTKCRGHE
jgi:hypothetical protein